MALTHLGDQQHLDQIDVRDLSGGDKGDQAVTTTRSTKTPGNSGKWDAFGNWVDSGVSATAIGATPILDSSTNEPILDDNGNWIFPG